MKKIYTYMMMVLMALPMLTLTSCDRDAQDRYEARTLEGTWTGYIDTYYFDRWGKRGETFRTSIYFGRENPYGGWGYEIDYNISNRYVDYYCEFRWEVYNGRIRIKYDDSWGYVYIYDHNISPDGGFFEGYMDDGTSRDIHFQLTYDNAFNWDSWRKSWRRSQVPNDSIANKSQSGK